MKHVFTVHSPITFLSAHATIVHLRLTIKDVVIFCNNYNPPYDKYNCVPFWENINDSFLKKVLHVNTPKEEDKYVAKHTEGCDYIAYVDMMYYFQRVLVTNEKCKGFNYIEEGNSSYTVRNNLQTLTWDKRHHSFRLDNLKETFGALLRSIKWTIRGYSHRILALPYSYDNYQFLNDIKYYSFSHYGFPMVQNDKKVVVAIKMDSAIHEMAKNIMYSNSVIWVDGSNKAFTGLSDEVYHRAIDKAIDLMRETLKQNRVVLKLRPGIVDFESNYLYNTLMKIGIDVTVMRDDIVLEAVLANSTNCVVIGNLSSALFYGKIFGHQSFSLYGLYDIFVPTIFDDMPGYWDLVEKLPSSKTNFVHLKK